MKEVLVLGGGGFIGRNIVEFLVNRGDCNVTAADIKEGSNWREISMDECRRDRFKAVLADFTDISAFDNLNQSFDEVYMLAAVVGVNRTLKFPQDVIRINTLLTMNTLDWISRNPIKRLLFYGLRGLVNAKTWYHEQKEPMLYHNSTIYVGFGNATRTDMQTSVGGIDSLIDQKIVHELLHALWDKLGGEKQSELHKDGINFLEGFTTYGDRYWLLDFYPEGYQLTDRGVGKYKVGVMKVKDLINQRGEGIFLRIPSEWKTLTVSHKP